MKKLLSVLMAFVLLATCCMGLLVSAETAKVEPEVDPESPLYKKMALFVGDSICEAIKEQQDPEYKYRFGWGGRILYNNEMRGVNIGKSGASMSDCRGANTILAQLQRYASTGSNFDYVIIHGGVNDAWDSCAVGTMTEGFDGPFDMTTFAGGLETTFKFAKENFPNAYLGYIINFSIPNSRQTSLSDMSAYFTVAKEICDKWEIPYLDFYFDDDFNKNIMKTHTDENLYDYIHCRTSGYEILTPRIEAWMETLHIKEEPPVESTPEETTPESTPESTPTQSVTGTESTSVPEDNESSNTLTIVLVIVGIVVVGGAVATAFVAKKRK